MEGIISTKTIYEMQKHYGDEQASDLVCSINKVFNNVVSENDDKFKRAIEILELMSKDDNNEKYITLSAEHIYESMLKNPNECIKLVQCIAFFECGMSKMMKQKFISWTKSNVNANMKTTKNIKKYPTISLNILNIFRNDIETLEYGIIGKDIIENSNDDVCDISLSLLRLFRSEFDSDETHDEYKKLLIKHIVNVDLRENIVDDIYQHFANRDFEQDFVDEIIKYEDILSKEKYLKGFISQFNDEENSNILQKTIHDADFKYIGNIKCLFSLYLDKSYIVIIKMLINRIQGDETVAYLLVILKFIVLEIDIEIESKIKIGAILLDVCDETDIIEIVDVCRKIGVIYNKSLKHDWGEACYNAFKNTNLDEQKIAIFSLVLDNKIEQSFQNSGKEKREFSDNEVALMKNYKKSNSIKSKN